MTAPAILVAIHLVAGLVVLAEGMRRIEALSPTAPGLTWRQRVLQSIEASIWIVLSVGAGGAVITPLLPLERPTFQDACVLTGVALLILYRRYSRGDACRN